jgi:uncharacterized membrane protein (UPF0127 family)
MNLAKAKGAVTASCEGTVVIPPVKVADSFWLRAVGLMGKSAVPEAYGAGLFFPGCRALHTCFMRFPLEVLFLDADGQVLEVRRGVPAWSVVKGPKGTVHCVEVQGELSGLSAEKPLIWRTIEEIS